MNQSFTRLSVMIAFVCSISGYAQSQTGQHDFPEITFATGKYSIEKAVFYKNHLTAKNGHAASRQLALSFETNTLAEYCNYFSPGNCHVDSLTYTAWKSQLGNIRPVIIASFDLVSGNRQYAVIKYTLTSGDHVYANAQLFTKWQNQWYFCTLEENVANADLIMFFTVTREAFFQALGSEDPRITNSPCTDFQQQLDGEKLIEHFLEKYRAQSPCYDVLNLIFEDRIKSVSPHTVSVYPEYTSYIKASGLPLEEIAYITRLVEAHQTHAAVDHLASLTGRPVKEIRSGIQKAHHDEK